MSFLGNLASSALGIAGSIWSADRANSAQSAMLQEQMNFNREVMQNRHQWEVQDLRQAGLNPLMSVTSPTGTLSAPSPASAHKADIASSALQLGQLSVAEKQADAQLNSAQAMLKNADTAYLAMKNNARDIESQISTRDIQNNVAWVEANTHARLAESQQELNKANAVKAELENKWIPKINQANLDEINQRIANSILEVGAKIVLMDREGRSMLTNAQANYMTAVTLEKNGVSLRNLNSAQVQHVFQSMGIEADKWKLQKPIEQYKSDKAKYDHELFAGDGLGSSMYRSSHAMGTVLSNLVGLPALSGVFK